MRRSITIAAAALLGLAACDMPTEELLANEPAKVDEATAADVKNNDTEAAEVPSSTTEAARSVREPATEIVSETTTETVVEKLATASEQSNADTDSSATTAEKKMDTAAAAEPATTTPTVEDFANIPMKQIYRDRDLQLAYVKAWIRQTFPEDYETMLRIYQCESPSTLRHWQANGTLVPHDQGASTARGGFQVLVGLHGPDIRKRGLNMQNIADYMTFVRYLYDRPPSRFSDWKPSESCWRNYQLASN